jgi:DNA helicase-2/ATP-dependent DNA helicase PcrA
VELDRTLDTEEAPPDAVTLITLHNTKGLEFPRVIITGLERGIFPRSDKAGDDLEEERRLFYVGITRAKDELYLTACSQRRLYGHTERMRPSPFLSEIDDALLVTLGEKPQPLPEYEAEG